MVYVVMAECGEDRDRSVWVAGVYYTEDEAQDVIRIHQEKRLVWEVWGNTVDAVHERARELFQAEQGQFSWKRPSHFKTYLEAEIARTPIPPEPERENGEHFSYRAMEMGRWYGQ